MRAVEIHRELCAVVYGQNVMSEGTVRQWRRMLMDKQMFTMKKEMIGRSSVVSDDLVQGTDQQICERRR
jgi:hypothetical protein